MLIWVASYPRSGNTLTMMVLRDVFGIGRIGTALGDDTDLGMLSQALPRARRDVWRPSPGLAALPASELLSRIRPEPERFFIKTHRVADAEDPAPAIYLVRDGRDALVSQAHFKAGHKGFNNPSFRRRLAKLIDGGSGNRGTWSKNVARWCSRSAPTAVIRFEDLVQDPVDEVAGALIELGLQPPPITGALPTFREANEQMPRVFRRGQIGSWRDEMPPALEERFWRLNGEQMSALGYDR